MATRLCDCFDNCGICKYSFLTVRFLFCVYTLKCNHSEICCLCGLRMAMCSVYRTRYISGSLCSVFMVMLCCPLCSICQLQQDIDRRNELMIF
uniref:Placenta associated 8, tandem duplicate 1 n=1 Tax=Sphaeramia orbicularis TaxID=375764 RepID=A0A673C9C8_9TELE